MDRKQAARELRRALELFANTLTDEGTMQEVASLYPLWSAGQAYSAGDIVRYGETADGEARLYRVAQAHSSQADWTPEAAASLFTSIGFTEDGTSVWVQPTGAHDAYQAGDVVSYDGQQYRSTIDSNVWAPGVYGWELVV
ncbi:MAG: hypothetical protein LUG13_07320 [Oscillospiraceae bacterium]|nr:hypothetical protein [Oscillospiraceae bacterium]